ncbi:NUDIX hydrolase [Arcicella lustrica]|uniref:NUDIX domain-containing protein n=1 Tax=Arcicella lustrica TaxID=2984196 RepID=A0ABU5SKP1_9BACT|nr:NUDIX domain-containing protein [Arcicella sp. DC25W]MEA5427870.1 NUDIX domain-containing protein [Arcicella sp. DC25W]
MELKNYAPSKLNYIHQITIDCVILGYSNKEIKVLVPKLIFNGDFFALPSGFVFQDEDVDDAAKRILHERTGLENVYLEQFQVFGQAKRNSTAFLDKLTALNPDIVSDQNMATREHEWFTKRFISIGYYALVDINKVVPQKSSLDQSISWFNIKDIPEMIMDHKQIVIEARNALRVDLDEKISAFKLLPETFTIKEIQELYETIYEKEFVRTNFQKKILELNVLERLEKKYTGAKNKAPYLYKFKS